MQFIKSVIEYAKEEQAFERIWIDKQESFLLHLFWAFREVASYRWNLLICSKKGHDIRSVGVDAECGGEDLHCNRCGFETTVYH